MTTMRPIRTSPPPCWWPAWPPRLRHSQPDQPTTPPSQPPVVPRTPTPAPPTPTPAPGPTARPRILSR